MALAGSNISVCHKYRKPFLTEITLRKIPRKKIFFMKIDIFGIFGPKTEKMGHARKWFFFRFCPFF